MSFSLLLYENVSLKVYIVIIYGFNARRLAA